MSTKVPIRTARQSDMSYVLNSWCRSSHSHLESALYLSKQGTAPGYALYKLLFDDTQRRILRRPSTVILIATNDDDDDQILGFLIYEAPTVDRPITLHYIQTKQELWRKGIASALLEHAGARDGEPCVYTFSSPIFSKVRAPNKWTHVPHWLAKETR